MSSLAGAAMTQMGSFISDYAEIWAIPVGLCAVGLVLTVVVNALRNKG